MLADIKQCRGKHVGPDRVCWDGEGSGGGKGGGKVLDGEGLPGLTPKRSAGRSWEVGE